MEIQHWKSLKGILQLLSLPFTREEQVVVLAIRYEFFNDTYVHILSYTHYIFLTNSNAEKTQKYLYKTKMFTT